MLVCVCVYISLDFTIIIFPSNVPSVSSHTHVNSSICLSHSLFLVLTTPAFLFTPSPLSRRSRSADSMELFWVSHDLIRRASVSYTDVSLSSTWQTSGLRFFNIDDSNRECFTITNNQTNHMHLTVQIVPKWNKKNTPTHANTPTSSNLCVITVNKPDCCSFDEWYGFNWNYWFPREALVNW